MDELKLAKIEKMPFCIDREAFFMYNCFSS